MSSFRTNSVFNRKKVLQTPQFTNKCFNALNDSECVLGIFIDFSKAFDTVDHTILITKLEKFYDFSDSAVSWFSD